MAPQPNVSLNSPNKPSKLLALIALVVAFSLPFILVKTFPHKNKSLVERIPQLSPELERQSDSPSVPFKSNAPQTPVVSSKPMVKEVKTPLATPPANSSTSNNVLPQTNKVRPLATVKPLPPQQKEAWIVIKSRNKDTMASVFSRAGVSSQTLSKILRNNTYSKYLSRLQPNLKIELLIKNHTLEKIILPLTSTKYLLVYREGDKYKTKVNQHKMTTRNQFITAVVHGSLYGTAKRRSIPYKLMQQMTEIFTWDINFAKDVKEGDQFTIIYKAFYVEDKLVNTGDIIAVSYRNHGKTFQAVRHTSHTGHSEYYTPQGTSLKKAFTRYPIHFSHISSSFSLSRYHPILHYRRAHKGVDLAARIGTPIQATGAGRIEIIGRQNAYGNMIKIKHNRTYSTIYGHMLKFQKGLSRGSMVNRGQIIGYVGQTGLASGPHCHYEFHINNQPKNPSTINLPRGEAISGRELARFKANTNTLLAQLRSHEKTQLASRGK